MEFINELIILVLLYSFLATETTKHSQSNANKIEKTKISKINEEKAQDSSDDSSADLAAKQQTSRPKSQAGKLLRVSSDSEEDVEEKSQKG